MKKLFLGFIISICFIFSIVLTACKINNAYIEYKVEHYLENIDYNEYTLFETEVLKGKKNKETEASYKDYTGFSHSEELEQKTINKKEDNTIKLYYSRNSYKLKLFNESIDMGNIIDNSGTYKFEEIVKLTAEPNEGYVFDGWYNNDELLSTKETYDYKMGSSNIHITAKFAFQTYNVLIDNRTGELDVYGESEIDIAGAGIQKFRSTVKLTADKKENFTTLIWFLDDEVFGIGNEIEFEMPHNDLNFKVIKVLDTDIYSVASNHVYFGTYPQILEKNTDIISGLNEKLEGLPSENNLNGWIDTNYYISSNPSSYMYYIDLEYNDDKYRGLYFNQYRPYDLIQASNKDKSFQDDQGFELNTVYWFKYRPIKWNILNENDDNMLIMATLGIDVEEFYTSRSEEEIEHNDGLGYANNYQLSNIRKWLNDNFYNLAFTEYQKLFIEQYEIEDSVFDNVFLLSYDELVNIYDKDNTGNIDSSILTSYASDYARASGAYKTKELGSKWMLRSNTSDGCYMNIITYNGLYKNGDGNPQSEVVTKTDITIKPVLLLKKYPNGVSEINVVDIENGIARYEGEEYQNGKVTNGFEICLWAIPDEGYTFVEWRTEEGVDTTREGYVVIGFDQNINLTPIFTYYTVTTTIDNSDAGTLITNYNDTKITANDPFDLKVDINDGYTFLGWYIGEELIGAFKNDGYIMPKENIVIEARTIAYTLTTTIDNQAAGSVSEFNETKVTAGKTKELEIELTDGYTFLGWYINNELVSPDTKFTYTMTNLDVVIEAKTTYYTLTTTIDEENAGTITEFNETKVTVGKTKELEIEIADGYTFLGWYINDELVSPDPKFQYTMTNSNVIIEARTIIYFLNVDYYLNNGFENAHKVTFETNSENKIWNQYSNNLVYKIPTKEGYSFAGWYDNQEFNGNVFDFEETITEDITLYAKWIEKDQDLKYIPYGTNNILTVYSNGADFSDYIKVIPFMDGKLYLWSIYHYGNDYGYYELYDSNKELIESKILHDGDWTVFQSLDYGTVEAGKTYYFRFKPSRLWYGYENFNTRIYFTQDIPSLGYNFATNTEYLNKAITAGKTVKLTANPINGSTFKGWYINDQIVSSDKVYEFEMPRENLNIYARYSYYTLTTTKNLDEAGTITNYNNQRVEVGTDITLKATPNDGYAFIGWYEGDNFVSDELEYVYRMLAFDITFEARFIELSTSLTKNIDEAGSVSISNNLVLGKPAIITATVIYGYIFDGWYDSSNTKISSDLEYEIIIAEENIYEARYYENKTLISKSIDESGTISKFDFGYLLNQELELTFTINDGYTWRGWYLNDELLSTDKTINIVITKEVLSYVAKCDEYKVLINSNVEFRDYALIKFDTLGGNELEPMKSSEAKYIVPTRSGYLFAGWYDDLEYTIIHDFTATIEDDIKIYAKWILEEIEVMPFNQTVTRYLPIRDYNSNPKWYSFYALETSTATLNMTYPSGSNNYGHVITVYESDKTTIVKQVVSERNSELNMPFDIEAGKTYYIETRRYFSNAGTNVRFTFNVTLPEVSYITNRSNQVIEAGKTVNLFAEQKPGYVFDGWYLDDELITTNSYYIFTMPEANMNFEVRYTAKNDTIYKVLHYQENILDDEYELVDTDEYTGTTDTLTNVIANVYVGFEAPEFEQINIDGDGTSELKIYYKRIKYNIQTNILNDNTGEILFGDIPYFVATNDETYPWTVEGNNITSTNHDHGSTSSYTLNINLDGTIIYNVRASSEYADRFRVYKNGKELEGYIAADTANLENQQIAVKKGDVITFKYIKDSSISQKDDTIYVTDLRLEYSNYYKYGQEIKFSAIPNEGCSFYGWYIGDNLVTSDEVLTLTASSDVIYNAYLDLTHINYTVNHYIENANDDDFTLTQEILVGKNTLYTEAKALDLDHFDVSTFEQELITLNSNIVIDIYYTRNKYNYYVQNNIGAAGTVTLSKSEYKYGETTHAELVSVNAGYHFKGWKISADIISTETVYEMDMPAYDVYLSAIFEAIYDRNGNKITFGSYPQSEVSKDSIISELNILAGDVEGWTDYGFYSNGEAKSYMFYKDIDEDEDGRFDYRGVYIDEYRPYEASYSCGSLDSYQDDNGYEMGRTYWFKYDPIEWTILTEEDGKALIVSDLIIDTREYQVNYEATDSCHYDLSSIRAWLNDEFYNLAFDTYQKELIEFTTVDNSEDSTDMSSPEYCENTNDYIFLLSNLEKNTYSSKISSTSSTSYANALGQSDDYIWWTRSPYITGRAITSDNNNFKEVDYALGIRPALVINL